MKQNKTMNNSSKYWENVGSTILIKVKKTWKNYKLFLFFDVLCKTLSWLQGISVLTFKL